MSFVTATYPRIIFADNPLKVVAVQIRFPAEFRLGEAETLAGLQHRLRARYPMPAATRTQMQVTLSVGPDGIAQSRQAVGLGPRQFLSEDGDWVVGVGPEVVSLETTAYRTWDDFIGRWREVLEAIRDTQAPTHISRLGLRYVDELRNATARTIADWRRFLRPDLLGTAGGDLLADHVTRTQERISLSVEDSGVTLQHGFVQNEAGVADPSIYTIDTDLFTTRQLAFDIDAILERLERYHRWAWNLFRGSITDEMLNALGEAQS